MTTGSSVDIALLAFFIYGKMPSQLMAEAAGKPTIPHEVAIKTRGFIANDVTMGKLSTTV